MSLVGKPYHKNNSSSSLRFKTRATEENQHLKQHAFITYKITYKTIVTYKTIAKTLNDWKKLGTQKPAPLSRYWQ